MDQHTTTKLPLINSTSSHQQLDFYFSGSPLLGLIQWCTITPLTAGLNLYGKTSFKEDMKSPILKSPTVKMTLLTKSSSESKDASILLAEIHANLLSSILCGLQQTPLQLTGKHSYLLNGNDLKSVASVLIDLKQKLLKSELTKSAVSAVTSWMEESVERLAQYLQVLLSTGLLSIKQGITLIICGCFLACVHLL